jgi:hypothetical protein
MGDLKSLSLLWGYLARNQRYQLFVEDRDIRVFGERLANEGLPFLTQELPLIGKALDRYHSTNEWIPPKGFTLSGSLFLKEGMSSDDKIAFNIPLFLGKAVRAALNGDPAAVDCVRQLSYVFYKLEVGYEETVIEKFLARFKNNDRELNDFFNKSDPYLDLLLKKMRELIGRVLCNTNPLDITPSHGSGATACRTANWDKYHKLRYYKKLDDVFPYSDYFFLNYTHLSDELQLLEEAEVSFPQARICLVPKDARGPRVISCEPAELMFIQQGLMRKLYDVIERHPLTTGRVNFLDQSINRSLAREASITDELATIDLSDASDRVSLDLVRRVFPSDWVEALEACRSESTRIEATGEVVILNKFAPMGSACCFPVEALVFWACAEAAIQLNSGSYRTKYDREFTAVVYGDDIIIASNFAEAVIHGLESIGLLVNRDKCYVKGPFRESCGGDFYLGVEVTPVRLRRFLGLSGTMLESSADFMNNLIMKFGESGSHRLLEHIEESIGYIFPRTEMMLPGTIRVTTSASNDVFFRRKWNKTLQRFEHRVLQTTSKYEKRRPPNWGELFRKQLTGRTVEQPDRYVNRIAISDGRLEPGQYTVPHSECTKWVWTWLG